MGVFKTLKNMIKPGRSRIKRTLRRAGVEDMSASNFSSVNDAKRYIHDLKSQKKSRNKSRKERKAEKNSELNNEIRMRLGALGHYYPDLGHFGQGPPLKSLAGISKDTINNPTELFSRFQEAVHELTAIANNDVEARISKYRSKLDAAQKLKIDAEGDTHIDRTLLTIFRDKLAVVEKKLTDNEKVYEQRWRELDTQKDMLLRGYSGCADTTKREYVRDLTASLENARAIQDTGQFKQYLETLRPIVDGCASPEQKLANNVARIQVFLEKVKRFKTNNPKCEKLTAKLKPSLDKLTDMLHELEVTKVVDDKLLTDTLNQANLLYDAVGLECNKISTADIAQASPLWTAAKWGTGLAAVGTLGAVALGFATPGGIIAGVGAAGAAALTAGKTAALAGLAMGKDGVEAAKAWYAGNPSNIPQYYAASGQPIYSTQNQQFAPDFGLPSYSNQPQIGPPTNPHSQNATHPGGSTNHPSSANPGQQRVHAPTSVTYVDQQGNQHVATQVGPPGASSWVDTISNAAGRVMNGARTLVGTAAEANYMYNSMNGIAHQHGLGNSGFGAAGYGPPPGHSGYGPPPGYYPQRPFGTGGTRKRTSKEHKTPRPRRASRLAQSVQRKA